jgi:hypothetical protein
LSAPAPGDGGAAAYDAKACGLCPRVLEAHCELHGAEQPSFCDLLERYRTDPSYGPDDVHYDLMRISTPEQRTQVTAALRKADGGAWMRPPSPALGTPSPPRTA